MYGRYYKNVVKAEKTGEREVTFTFDMAGNRELPQILGQLTVFPKHFWEATGKNGEPRDLAKSTLEVPLGSGPYKVKEFDTGNRIVLERVQDTGRRTCRRGGPVQFRRAEISVFPRAHCGVRGLQGGRADFWRESTARDWATQYKFPAIEKGWVKKEAIPTKGVARMQGLVFNTRRDKFKDPRVRQAFNYAFDFEDLNRSPVPRAAWVSTAPCSYQPVQALTLQANVGWSGLELDSDVPFGTPSVVLFQGGERVNLSPEWTGSVGGSYRVATPARRLDAVISSSFNYRSSVTLRYLMASTLTPSESESTRNLKASVGLESDRWTLLLFGDNLLDDRDGIMPPDLTFAGTSIRQRPRTIGLQATFNY